MTVAIGARAAAVSVSLAAHVALIAAAPPQPSRARLVTAGSTSQLIEFTSVTRDVASEAAATTGDSAATPTPRGAASAMHEPHAKRMHSGPSPARETTTPTNVAAATTPAMIAAPATVGVAHFTLPPSGQWAASIATLAAPKTNTVEREPGPDVVSEREVSTRAKLVSAAEVSYPAEARAAEIEADVPVEIVVDAHGAVADARALARSGYGLDDAALTAIRSYRFEPAVRDHRRVAVRMRWRVSFRLR